MTCLCFAVGAGSEDVLSEEQRHAVCLHALLHEAQTVPEVASSSPPFGNECRRHRRSRSAARDICWAPDWKQEGQGCPRRRGMRGQSGGIDRQVHRRGSIIYSGVVNREGVFHGGNLKRQDIADRLEKQGDTREFNTIGGILPLQEKPAKKKAKPSKCGVKLA